MSREFHTTTLSNIAEWIRAVQGEHHSDNNNSLRHVTDEALLGVQQLHTAVVRQLVERAVDLLDQNEQQQQEQSSGTNKKRKVVTLFQEAHAQWGLESEWEKALAYQQKQQQSAQGEASSNKASTKAQRKRARKQPVDPESLEEQERMFEQARKRLEQKKDVA